MRRLLLATALGAAALAGPSSAAPPQGIVRPGDEAGKPLLQLGAELFAGNCATCHGADGRGVSGAQATRGAGDVKGRGPSLRGVGARAADFYLRTGYMPLQRAGLQPRRTRVFFDEDQLDALIAYVASLGKGPPVPKPHPERGNLSRGLHLFTDHCAGCHQVVGEGGYVTGAVPPPLDDATPTQIAEAVRIGPYVMPRFSAHDLSDAELDSIIRYVQYTKNPDDRGGWAIGHIGPVPEGLVTWFLAAVALIGVCVLLGQRLKREAG
jgi:ubiquinol-cytochrome c reductase cytochrome c subunit